MILASQCYEGSTISKVHVWVKQNDSTENNKENEKQLIERFFKNKKDSSILIKKSTTTFETLEKFDAYIQALEKEKTQSKGNLQIFDILDHALLEYVKLFESKLQYGRVSLKVYIIDFYKFWMFVFPYILNKKLKNIDIQILLVEDNHKIIEHKLYIPDSYELVKNFINSNDLKLMSININIKRTSLVPYVQGFSINDNDLFISQVLWTDAGQIDTQNCFYNYFTNSDEVGLKNHSLFNNWFKQALNCVTDNS